MVGLIWALFFAGHYCIKRDPMAYPTEKSMTSFVLFAMALMTTGLVLAGAFFKMALHGIFG